MAFIRNNLVSRSGYSGDDATTSVGTTLGKLVASLLGPAQPPPADADMAAAMAAQQAQSGGGIDPTLVIGGVAAVGIAYLLLRKKRK